MSGKTTRKVTVETSNRLSTDTSSLSITTEQGSKMKKRSVFERLGTAGVSYEVKYKTGLLAWACMQNPDPDIRLLKVTGQLATHLGQVASTKDNSPHLTL